uniref:Uncharacterized protein n=1 Tax=Timema tahoe TaxID=61484 RepID=A0A7R9IAQ6_9NEOP|nr:unnamed protein product [Timema tahoe]
MADIVASTGSMIVVSNRLPFVLKRDPSTGDLERKARSLRSQQNLFWGWSQQHLFWGWSQQNLFWGSVPGKSLLGSLAS